MVPIAPHKQKHVEIFIWQAWSLCLQYVFSHGEHPLHSSTGWDCCIVFDKQVDYDLHIQGDSICRDRNFMLEA